MDLELPTIIDNRICVYKGDESLQNVLRESCRICLGTNEELLIAPCKCRGTLKYVHESCLKQWIFVKFNRSQTAFCELCQYNFQTKCTHEYNPKAARENNYCKCTIIVLSLIILFLMLLILVIVICYRLDFTHQALLSYITIGAILFPIILIISIILILLPKVLFIKTTVQIFPSAQTS